MLPRAITHRTPFEERWGGWYVTGTHGSMRHRGNAVASDQSRPFDLDEEGTQNITSLEGRIDVSAYLAPTIDLVALMTLEHQVHMHNLLARTARQARAVAAAEDRSTNAAAVKAFDTGMAELVSYMLFADEARLAQPVRGVSTFTATFARRGPFDRHGRSLREFDLTTRLFRYPLTYMIYSEAFDALPPHAKDAIYRRLFQTLRSGAGVTGLSAEDRQAIVEIVLDTKEGLPK